jgi:integrase
MPVRRHGKGWEVRVQSAGQRFSKTVGNRRDAFELERLVRARLTDRLLGRTPRYTLEEALTRWLTGEAKLLKSYRDLKNKVREMYPQIQGKPLAAIVEVAEAVKSEGIKAGLLPATINRRLAVLRRVANLAYRQWGWLETSLGERIRLLPGERQRHVYLTPTEVQRLAAAAPTKRAREAILLAAMSGLRKGELLALKATDRQDGALSLPDTKSGRPRVVPLPPEAIAIPLPIKLTVDELRKAFDIARAKAKLPHVRFHDLRRTYGTWLINAGASLAAIRDLLGHSNISVTSRYLATSTSDLKAAVKKLPALQVSRKIAGGAGAETTRSRRRNDPRGS